MSRLMDPKDSTGKFPFEWVSSDKTDIRKTWKKFTSAAPQSSSSTATPEPSEMASGSAAAAPKTIAFRRKA